MSKTASTSFLEKIGWREIAKARLRIPEGVGVLLGSIASILACPRQVRLSTESDRITDVVFGRFVQQSDIRTPNFDSIRSPRRHARARTAEWPSRAPWQS